MTIEPGDVVFMTGIVPGTSVHYERERGIVQRMDNHRTLALVKFDNGQLWTVDRESLHDDPPIELDLG